MNLKAMSSSILLAFAVIIKAIYARIKPLPYSTAKMAIFDILLEVQVGYIER
jgi:hypothetical protein